MFVNRFVIFRFVRGSVGLRVQIKEIFSISQNIIRDFLYLYVLINVILLIMSTVKDRLLSFIKKSNITTAEFERTISVSNGYVKNISKSIQPDILEKISNIYPYLNIEWLLIGKGDMLKNTGDVIGSVQGNGKIEYKNTGNVEFGNNINVSLPETGTQKIIKPDGTVELTSSDSNSLELENAKKEIEELRLTISHLKDNMSVKDELIASLKETIDLLKHRQ